MVVRSILRVASVVAVAALAAAAAASAATAAAADRPPLPAVGHLRVPTVAARARPDAAAPVVRVFREFRDDYRPQVVLAVGARQGGDGRMWVRVHAPMRPNGRLAWIPETSVQLRAVTSRIVIHRGARRLDLYRGHRRVYTTTVAVGAPGMETPVGRFYVTARFVPSDSFLGSFAFETSAYSKLSEWPGGGVVGIHGTSMPWLLGRAVSHGCVRISNTAALVLKRYVTLGTPIQISA